jgi:hypothetical protein
LLFSLEKPHFQQKECVAREMQVVSYSKQPHSQFFKKSKTMNIVKYSFLAVAATFFIVPEIQAQNYTQRGTRNGAIAGAIIGGLVGANNDRPLAGAAIGGLIGGATGRAIGTSKDNRFYGGHQGNFNRNFVPVNVHQRNHFNNGFNRPVYHQSISHPVYGGGFHGGGRLPYGYPSYGRPGCSGRGW